MAKRQSGEDRKKTETERFSDLKHLLVTGSVVGGILLTLVIAAVLRVEPEAAATLPFRPSGSDNAPAESNRLPDRAENPAAHGAPGSEELALRALDDQRRLTTTADEWTLQFMVTCKEETAQQILGATGGDRRLYLLPVLLDDQPCFRVCWDRYPSREQARSGSEVPGTLVVLNDNPVPRQIQGLMP